MSLVFDISYWQPNNTVEKIKRLGAEGAILRLGLTYGGIPELDSKFVKFVNEVVSTPYIPFGIYYYNKFQTDGQAMMEAQYINDRVYDLLGGKEPPLGTWFDIEDSLVKNQWTHDILMKTIGTMNSWGFKKVGIYTGYYFAKDYLDLYEIQCKQIPMWIANYDRKNWLKEEWPYLNWHGWQFTETYDGNSLDANEWYVSI